MFASQVLRLKILDRVLQKIQYDHKELKIKTGNLMKYETSIGSIHGGSQYSWKFSNDIKLTYLMNYLAHVIAPYIKLFCILKIHLFYGSSHDPIICNHLVI